MKFKKNLHPLKWGRIFIECLVSAFSSGRCVSKLQMMRKKHELTELNTLIISSEIYEAFGLIEKAFKSYGCSEKRNDYRYEINAEFSTINQEIEHFKVLLEELIDQASKWEARE